MPSDEEAVLAANRSFYDAFSSRDFEAMDALWARAHPVACVHPGWHGLGSRDEVMASWRAILGNDGAPRVSCSGANVYVLGDVAYVVCNERFPGARLVATNVFVREESVWKMVHHHASGVAPQAAEDDEPPPGELLN